MKLTRRELLIATPLMAWAAKLEDFKLGVTSDEIDEDLRTAAKFLGEFRLKWTEIRNLWGKYNTSQPIERIQEAKGILNEYGINLSVLATGFFKVPLPAKDADLDKEWKTLDDAFERAKILGSNTLRTFAFTFRRGEKPDPAVYPRIYELVQESARRAKAKGFRLAVENVGESYVWTGAQSAALLKAVKEDSLGLTWDPNNAGAGGEQSFPDGYKLLDPARIFHVHLRDYKRTPEGRTVWTAVGEGEFDNAGQLRALRRDGFKGTLTLETHWQSGQGKAHSTRVSLGGLLKVIEKV
jgi:sugar phosphate isomerase/epimerase